ncbi:MAG: hypothetical protein PHU12_03125 [Candidatus Aenigmarchaeota archaeon]|nr:hypothetical protein [Candidatus Aenigmarchaeota archaeon]
MEKTVKKPLVERLADPNVGDNPHEVARALAELHKTKNCAGVRELLDAYTRGLGKRFPDKPYSDITFLAEDNFLNAAGLADRVAECGYEATGQLHTIPSHDGPVAVFYQQAVSSR